MSDASVLQIVILNDGTLVGTEVVLPGTYAIGSDAASDLVLEDATVSSSHATLTYRDGRVFLEDAGSIGGLLVNGERTVSSEIKPKDDVTIGPFTLKIRVVAKKPPTKIASGHSLATTQPFASNKSVTGAAPAPLRPPLAQPLVKTPAPLQPAAPLQPIARPAPLQQKPAMPAAKAPVAAKPAPRPFAPARPTDPEMTPPASPNLLLPRPPPAAPLSTMEEVPIPISPGDLEQLKEVSADDWPSLVAPQPVKPSPAKPAPVAAKPAPAPEAQPAPVERTDPGNTQELPLSREAPPPELDPTSSTASPELRVRVFWGRATVSVRSFRAGEKVLAGPSDDAPVPLYSFPLPGDRYEIAQFGKGGWLARFPRGVRAYSLESGVWYPAEATELGEVSLFPITATHPVRLIEGNLIVELALRGPQPPAKAKFGGTIEPTLFGSFAITAFVVGMSLIFMPKAQKESSDFTPTHLAAIRAALVPPPKKDKPKPKEKERVAEKPRPTPQPKEDVPDKAPPKQPTVASTNQAIKAVQKLVSAGPAVQSILAATAKIGSGPKGYGDKGMGYKLSPLTGKPPIQMAGVGFGAGLGGFGTQTKGMGALRGMGDGGAPGQFAIGGIGKGHAVGGIVVQAPSRGATVKGTMDREAVAKVINEHIAEVRGCYERALLREPGLAGKLVLEWTIGTPGTVSEVRTKSVTLRNTDVTNCIITSLKTWRFPKPTGGVVVVSYPFLFNSVGF